MPTILINTNLLTSKPGDVNCCASKENGHASPDQADFKQDLNSIISKLLAKSETMDSFMIKYDVDDILKNKENYTSMPGCVCKRLATIFSDVLSCKSTNATDQNSVATNEEIKEIYSELKTIRNYQSDLADKFNLVMNVLSQNNNNGSNNNKLFGPTPSFRPATSNQQINKNLNANQNSRHKVHRDANNFLSSSQYNDNTNNSDNVSTRVSSSNQAVANQNIQIHLTGARKRKNMSVQKNEIEPSDENDLNDQNNAANSQDNDEAAEFEDEHLQCLIEEDLELDAEQLMDEKTNENLPVNNNKLSDAGQHSDSKRIHSDENTKSANDDYSSVDEQLDHNPGSNEANSDMEIQLQKDDDQLHEIQEVSHVKSPSNLRSRNSKEQISHEADTDHLDGYSNNNENISNNLNDNNNGLDEDSAYIDYQQYSNSNEAGNEHFNFNSSNHRSQTSYTNSFKQQQQQTVYKTTNNGHPPSGSRNILNSNYLKQQQQQRVSPVQHNIMPSKKFRFINQSPTPQNNNYQPQQNTNYYSIPNRLTQQQQQGVKLQTTPNRNTTSQAYDIKSEQRNSSFINEADSKFKPSQNTPKLSPNSEMNSSSSKNELTTDIDINELFKDGGPRFLQMELYKDFKPPIVLVDDKYFIDNMLASSAYSKSKSRRNFAAHLAKLVFTPRERLESNCNGRFGKKALDTTLLMAIRNTLFKFYPCKQSTLVLNGDTITSGDHDENGVWIRDCIPAIDESNRVLKKQLIAWYKKSHMSQPNINISSNNSSFVTNSSMDAGRSYNYSNTFRPLGAASNASNEDYDGTNYLNDDENEEDFDI